MMQKHCRFKAKSLEAGKRSEAVAGFRRAYELQPRKRTRDLLRDSLLDGLRTEFAAYRGRGDEIKRLLNNASERATYLRLMADGLRRAGELGSALECYRNLLELEPNRQPLDEIDKALLVRRDRWVESQLAELRETANGEWAAKIEQLARRCDAGLWPTFFGAPEKPAPSFKQGRAVKQNPEWPVGKIEIAVTPPKDRNVGLPPAPVEMQGNPTPCYRGLTLQWDRVAYGQESRVVAYDGLGQERWQFSPAENDLDNIRVPRSARSLACPRGELLLFFIGTKIVVLMDERTASHRQFCGAGI